jgi:lipopolysaccharide/colanic/teichoic acid biosynthesis glycosyltransferase
VLESLVRSVIDASTSGATPVARYEEGAKANSESLTRAKTALSGIERLDYDLRYIETWSLALDVKVIVRTALREFLSGSAE